ncbi:tuberculostearic acid methyltransferase [Physcia stellaris]|nr:tuberculostearic acid methyltransferase [Physcia stellaris]
MQLLMSRFLAPALPTLSTIARYAIIQKLEKIRYGQLLLISPDEQELRFGSGSEYVAEMRIVSERFWTRVLLYADIGFAQSFMLGYMTTPDLTALIQLFARNRSQLWDGYTYASAIVSSLSGWIQPRNSPSNSSLNVAAHYDMCNDMFESFLSPDMTYSCPIWIPTGPHADVSLEYAQLGKIHHIISAADIQPTDHVLEIGTGWGSFAVEAVRTTGCTVTSVTLSKDQKRTAEARIATEGFSSKIRILLCDYRKIPVPEDLYDKVVSIEMVEHVGPQYLETYFGAVDQLLKPTGGIAVVQSTTMPESIFPGGHIPSTACLITAMEKSSSDRLRLKQVETFGAHYAPTLRIWRQNFLKAFNCKIRPALLNKFPKMSALDLEVFSRKWEYYFSYCEAAFLARILDNVVLTVRKQI